MNGDSYEISSLTPSLHFLHKVMMAPRVEVNRLRLIRSLLINCNLYTIALSEPSRAIRDNLTFTVYSLLRVILLCYKGKSKIDMTTDWVRKPTLIHRQLLQHYLVEFLIQQPSALVVISSSWMQSSRWVMQYMRAHFQTIIGLMVVPHSKALELYRNWSTSHCRLSFYPFRDVLKINSALLLI